MTLSRNKKIAYSLLAAMTVITALVLVYLLTLDWNRARPWLNARASEALNRPFTIAGDLTLTWKKPASAQSKKNPDWYPQFSWPFLVAHDIRIGNPANMVSKEDKDKPASGQSAATPMATIERLTFTLNPLALLQKKIVVPLLYLKTPTIELQRSANGENNWTFSSKDEASSWKLDLQRIAFAKGSIHLVDAVKKADIRADIETISNDPVYGVVWQLDGKLNGEAVSGNGKAGAVLSLTNQTTPYPLEAFIQAGQSVISIAGTLTRPADLAALDMRLAFSGMSMGKLYAITGIYLPETPPFATEGHLTGSLGRGGQHWIYQGFRGRVGSSDLSGDLDLISTEGRPVLSGKVVSDSLHLADLGPLIGVQNNNGSVSAAQRQSQKVFPSKSFDTERWKTLDIEVGYNAQHIVLPGKLPLNKLATNIQLKDGILSLMPLNFELASGSLSSNIKLDGSGEAGKNAIKAELKITARHMKLQQLFAALQPLEASLGEINADASLSAVGNSIGSLLGASNGEVKALISQGTVSKLLLEEMGLNIGSIVLTRISGDKQVKLNCLAADFSVTNGLMQARSFIIDTDDAIIDVSGNVNLAREYIDLTVKPNSKGLRIISLRAPLYVQGDFRQPEVTIDKGVMAMRAGGAIALAVLAPFAALLPLTSSGPQESSECNNLLANARVRPVAPAPGRSR